MDGVVPAWGMPEAGPMASGPELFAGHPLHRRVEVLLDGLRVRVRPVLPTDAPAIAASLRRLSSRTSYLRFHSPVPRLSAAQLAAIVDVDHRDRETLLAYVERSGKPRLVGVAQYVRTSKGRAEVGVVVEDALQRHGIGALLLTRLGMAAAEVGLEAFEAHVLSENTAAIRLAHTVSVRVERSGQGTTRDLVCWLPRPPFGALTPARG